MDGWVELTQEKLVSREGLNEVNRMFRELYDSSVGDGQSVRVFKGYGTPESVVTAGVGALYQRLDGGANTTLYVKESGTGAIGWTVK